ncbi:MAG: PLP-dependent transferase, partial [Methylococcales bacterium]|nr:PLP-dependent transferase [Methylococcales bacterium]
FITHILPQFGVKVMGFDSWEKPADIQQRIETQGLADSLTMIYLETPTNPTNQLTDISAFRSVADHFSTDEKKVILAVDNTYLGPLWQHPLEVGADLSLYSATKFIAGHSDLIAGACMGNAELIARMKTLRAFMGNMASAWTCWLMQRSLETLKLRMQKQADNAVKLAEFLASHPAVEKVYYLGFLKDNDPAAYAIFQKQCTSAGSMLAFDIVGGEKEAFQFINHLKLIKLAVSLGSTESLVEHPATMTHSGMEPAHKEQLSITSKLVRISVGVEHVDDLISDVCQALETVELPEDLVGAELVSCV